MKKYTPLILTSLVALLALESKSTQLDGERFIDDIRPQAAVVSSPRDAMVPSRGATPKAKLAPSIPNKGMELETQEIKEIVSAEISPRAVNPAESEIEHMEEATNLVTANLEQGEEEKISSSISTNPQQQIDEKVPSLSRTQRALQFVRKHPAECFLAAFAAVTLYKNRGVILSVAKYLYDQSPKALPFLGEKVAYVRGSVLPAVANQVNSGTKIALSTVLEKAYGVHTQFKDVILPVVKDKANGLVIGSGQLLKNYKKNS